MIKKFFFLLILFFLSLNFLSAKPKPTPLPTFPKQKEAVLFHKQKVDVYKKNNPIIWSLNWHTGIQHINMRQVPNIDEIFLNMSELVFFSNQYKGAIFSVDISDLFSIYSNSSFGFTSGTFPKDFSTQTIPYQINNLSSLESDSYIAKNFPLTYNVSFSPYTGYSFSQYKLKPIEQVVTVSDRTYHSMILGGKFHFRIHRLFFIETSLSFSPLTYMDHDLLSFFQISYETNFTFTTNYFTFSFIIATRDNIEYSNNSSESNTLVISRTGFRFRFTI